MASLQSRMARTAALVGSDLPDVRPTFAVEVGDKVGVGQTLFVDRRRPESRTGRGLAGNRIRRRHEQVGSVIDIQQDPLGAFKENAFSGRTHGVQFGCRQSRVTEIDAGSHSIMPG